MINIISTDEEGREFRVGMYSKYKKFMQNCWPLCSDCYTYKHTCLFLEKAPPLFLQDHYRKWVEKEIGKIRLHRNLECTKEKENKQKKKRKKD